MLLLLDEGPYAFLLFAYFLGIIINRNNDDEGDLMRLLSEYICMNTCIYICMYRTFTFSRYRSWISMPQLAHWFLSAGGEQRQAASDGLDSPDSFFTSDLDCARKKKKKTMEFTPKRETRLVISTSRCFVFFSFFQEKQSVNRFRPLW